MLRYFLLLLLSVVNAQVDISFEKFVSKYRFKWVENSAEWTMRKQLFLQEQQRVAKHNASPDGKLWQEGINKFSAMTAQELKHYTGYSRGDFPNSLFF
jgi:hypothetical protein